MSAHARPNGLPKIVPGGRIPGTMQESVTYGKKLDAKATIAEAQALAAAAGERALMSARFAVGLAVTSGVCSLGAIVIALYLLFR